MRLLTIAMGEWKGRRLLGLGVLWFFGMALAVALPVLHGSKGQALLDERVTVAVGLSLAFSLVLAVFLGGAMINRDLREGRLSFYLALPLHPIELFFGKVLGVWLLCVVAGAVIFAPAVMLTGWADLGKMVGALSALSLLIVLGAHVLFFIVSARTLWMVLDYVSAAVGVWMYWQWLRHLQAIRPLDLQWAMNLGAAILAVVLLLASCAQMAVGRVSLAKGHRALSLTLAACVGACSLGGWIHLQLVQRTSWSAFSSVTMCIPAAKGPWVQVLESPRHWGVLNTETGKGLSLSPLSSMEFSEDGTRVAWVALSGFTRAEIWTATLADGVSKVQPTGLFATASPSYTRVVLSPSGRMVGLWEGRRLLVLDTLTGHRTELEVLSDPKSERRAKVLFTSEDVVRCYSVPEGKESLEIREWDLRSGKNQTTGRSAMNVEWPLLERDAVRDQVLIRGTQKGKPGIWLCDGKTGAMLKELGVSTSNAAAAFLADGSCVVAEAAEGGLRIAHWSIEGVELWHQTVAAEFRAPVFTRSSGLWWQAEKAPGCLQLVYHRGSMPGGVLDVDVSARTVQERQDGARPYARFDEERTPGMGSLASRLVFTPSGGLSVRSADGTSKTLVEGRSRR
jgi:hypothetical protein